MCVLPVCCLAQQTLAANLPRECIQLIKVHTPLPIASYKLAAGESFRTSPIFKFQVQEDGSVTDLKLIRSSDVAGIDKQFLTAIKDWKCKPRPTGCGIIETEMSVTIDWGSND